MAIFEGTIQEFHHFIGPRIRNAINNFTRNYRKKLNGICEHCKQEGVLHSAHVHGSERRTIIEKILQDYSHNGKIRCDIEESESNIISAHNPIESSFKFLCHTCHVAYDSTEKSATGITKPTAKPRFNDQTEIKDETQKVERKVPKWFNNPHQINSTILITFLKLKEAKKIVTTEELVQSCQAIRDFAGNYNQMKNFGEKNHAKVFEETNNIVELWQPVEQFILEAFNTYNQAQQIIQADRVNGSR